MTFFTTTILRPQKSNKKLNHKPHFQKISFLFQTFQAHKLPVYFIKNTLLGPWMAKNSKIYCKKLQRSFSQNLSSIGWKMTDLWQFQFSVHGTWTLERNKQVFHWNFQVNQIKKNRLMAVQIQGVYGNIPEFTYEHFSEVRWTLVNFSSILNLVFWDSPKLTYEHFSECFSLNISSQSH